MKALVPCLLGGMRLEKVDFYNFNVYLFIEGGE